MPSNDIVIIGAGPAGLTAAHELSRRGRTSLVLEADDQVGGLSRTVRYKEFRFDIGGHRFFSKSDYVNRLWREILPNDLLLCSRQSRIFYRGMFFDYPLAPLNAFAGLGALETLRVGVSYGMAKLFPAEPETSFTDWVTNRFGSRLFEIFFKTYTEKVWGIPCSDIASDWAAQRIKNLSLRQAVWDALLSNEEPAAGEVVTSLIKQFHYPRLGPGMMWEQCAAQLVESGQQVLLEQTVRRICHREGLVECVFASNSKGALSRFDVEHVISSMPLSKLVGALDPPAPDSVRQAANRLRYRDYMTVVLIVNKPEVFPDHWIYIHAPEVRVGRIQNYKNWSPDLVPDSSRTSLGLEYFLWKEDAEWQWPDERIIQQGIEECSYLGLIRPDEVEDGVVVRMKRAYPIYDQDFQTHLEVIRDYLSGFENLQTVGRNGLHRYNNQDHSMLTGLLAARNVLSEPGDVWSVNTERTHHEDGDQIQPPGDRLVPVPVNSSVTPSINEIFAALDPVAFGCAIGATAGTGILLLTLWTLRLPDQAAAASLSLLENYLMGFEVSRRGAFVGAGEAAFAGFAAGFGIAWLRNQALTAYAYWIRWRRNARESRKLLDKV